MIILAKTFDANILSKIAITSKTFWGYSIDLINSWKDDLTVSEEMINNMIVYKFLREDYVLGFYILNQPKETSIELEFLFVLPAFIGKGFGNQLMNHAFQKAKELNCKQITLWADPNAVPFYESKGFKVIDKKESSIVGRFLPLLQKDLEA